MKSRCRIAASLVAAAALALAIAVAPSLAGVARADEAASADKPLYLALGDSITYGYEPDPDDPHSKEGKPLTDECFVNILAAEKGYTFRNKGVIGNTAAGIMSQIQTGELDESIKESKVVTITCGGNDLMNVLYDKIASYYNTYVAKGDASKEINAYDVIHILWYNDSSDSRLNSLKFYALMALSIKDPTSGKRIYESPEFTAGVETFISNLNSVTAYIKDLNPDAQIYLSTQYNPYEHFTGSLKVVGTNIGKCAEKLRQAVLDNAEAGQYTPVDVFTAFAGRSAELCNATENPMALDFHPNAAGHAVIAAEFAKVVPGGAMVSADDASKVYGEADPELTATVSGTSEGDSLSYAVSREAGEDAGTYAVAASGETSQGGYLVAYKSGTFTIEAKSIVPDTSDTPAEQRTGVSVSEPADVDANGSEQRQAVSLFDAKTNKALVEGIDYDLSYAGDLVNPGTVAITVTGKGNYQGSFEVSYRINGQPGKGGDNGTKPAGGDRSAKTPATGDASLSFLPVAALGAVACAVARLACRGSEC